MKNLRRLRYSAVVPFDDKLPPRQGLEEFLAGHAIPHAAPPSPRLRDYDEHQVEAYMKNMASALFGVLATVGGVPVIRALPGGPTQMISEQLSKVRPATVCTPNDGLCTCCLVVFLPLGESCCGPLSLSTQGKDEMDFACGVLSRREHFAKRTKASEPCEAGLLMQINALVRMRSLTIALVDFSRFSRLLCINLAMFLAPRTAH